MSNEDFACVLRGTYQDDSMIAGALPINGINAPDWMAYGFTITAIVVFTSLVLVNYFKKKK